MVNLVPLWYLPFMGPVDEAVEHFCPIRPPLPKIAILVNQMGQAYEAPRLQADKYHRSPDAHQ